MSKIFVNAPVVASLPVVGNLSPFAFAKRPKGYAAGKTLVEFGGALRPTALTKGAGRGAATRYYAYFLDSEVQNWIEVTAETYAALAAGKTLRIDLRDAAPATPAEAPAETAPELVGPPAPAKRRAKRAETAPAQG